MSYPLDRVAVVVITRDRWLSLKESIGRLLALPDRPRVLVVDNASTDGTPEAMQRHFPSVELVALRRNMGAAARNEGVKRVSEDIVAFADDDSWWAPYALTRAARLFRHHPHLGLVAARVLVGPFQRLDSACQQMSKSPLRSAPDAPGPAVLGFLGCAAVVRRRAFIEAGGFHRHFGKGGEERLLALDLAARGWQLNYVDSVVAHRHSLPQNPDKGPVDVQLRNDLWSAWLRLRGSLALVSTAKLVTTGLTQPEKRRAIGDAIKGWRWVMRERRPVPPELNAVVRRLNW